MESEWALELGGRIVGIDRVGVVLCHLFLVKHLLVGLSQSICCFFHGGSLVVGLILLLLRKHANSSSRRILYLFVGHLAVLLDDHLAGRGHSSEKKIVMVNYRKVHLHVLVRGRDVEAVVKLDRRIFSVWQPSHDDFGVRLDLMLLVGYLNLARLNQVLHLVDGESEHVAAALASVGCLITGLDRLLKLP